MLHLIEGPVGAGKSTLALALARKHDALRFNLDDWFSVLFSPDRPETDIWAWYAERKERCIEMIWRQGCLSLDAGHNIVVELGLIQRADRAAFYSRVDDAGYALAVYVVDAPLEVRRERVRRRNQERGDTFAMEVSDAVFELASDFWEPPDDEECRERGITWYR